MNRNRVSEGRWERRGLIALGFRPRPTMGMGMENIKVPTPKNDAVGN